MQISSPQYLNEGGGGARHLARSIKKAQGNFFYFIFYFKANKDWPCYFQSWPEKSSTSTALAAIPPTPHPLRDFRVAVGVMGRVNI